MGHCNKNEAKKKGGSDQEAEQQNCQQEGKGEVGRRIQRMRNKMSRNEVKSGQNFSEAEMQSREVKKEQYFSHQEKEEDCDDHHAEDGGGGGGDDN